MDGDREPSGEPAVDRTKECSPMTSESVPTESVPTDQGPAAQGQPQPTQTNAEAGQARPVAARPSARPTAREINAQIVYTAFAVYSRIGDLDAPADKATAE